MSNSNSVGDGCGGIFIALLAILFIGLKLTNQIDWSWLWVLSPIWISVGLVGLIVSILLVWLLIIVISFVFLSKKK